MSEPAICSTIQPKPSPLDVLELRAWARAYLYSIGELALHEAVDVLQRDAERDGLVAELGQDGVQQILADAFRPYREGKSNMSPPNKDFIHEALGVEDKGPFDPNAFNRADPFADARGQANGQEAGADDELGDQAETAETASVESISLDSFYAYMPMHSYIYVPTREPWPAASVNARLGPVPVLDDKGKQKLDDKGRPEFISASKWLDQNRPVSQMTWAPGEPLIIADRLISHGGWIDRPGEACLNVYLPPTIASGNAAEADPWLEHVHKVYPNDAAHIIAWLAHRAQRPTEKINHALVLGGKQGTGKDTLLEPVKRTVGPWNFIEVMPSHMLGRFNGFLKAVVLRINEARDLGEVNRFAWYDHMKAYTAAPPDVLRCDEKNLREHSICCGVIITTNHKTDGIYLPADDRRHYVAWCELCKEDFAAGYWNSLWHWYSRGGYRHVAAYLLELNISTFDAKAPPPQTSAFWDIVTANRSPEDAELADVLDRLGNPDATTLTRVQNEATGEFEAWLRDRKNRRVIPHRFEGCGYTPVRNDAAKDGQWKIAGTRQTVYAKADLSVRDRLAAARRLTSATSATQHSEH